MSLNDLNPCTSKRSILMVLLPWFMLHFVSLGYCRYHKTVQTVAEPGPEDKRRIAF